MFRANSKLLNESLWRRFIRVPDPLSVSKLPPPPHIFKKRRGGPPPYFSLGLNERHFIHLGGRTHTHKSAPDPKPSATHEPHEHTTNETIHLRGVLGNKCAGQHNLKTVHFRDTLASSNFWGWSSAMSVFFCSALFTLVRRQQAFI